MAHLGNELWKTAIESSIIQQESAFLQLKMETVEDKQNYLEARS